MHCDLKPANILSVNQKWKLADFGLIRHIDDNKTYLETVNTAGTIVYMPPEAFEGNISSAWDVWSLGIMLVEMLTNQLPYRFGNDINKLMGKVMKGDLQVPSLPSEFQPIVQGCLQKERRQRWTAEQVLNALSGNESPRTKQVPFSKGDLGGSQKGKNFVEDLGNGIKLEMIYKTCTNTQMNLCNIYDNFFP